MTLLIKHHSNTLFFHVTALTVTLPGNYTVIEGQSAQVLVMLSTSDYEFDFNVTLMTMDGSAVG